MKAYIPLLVALVTGLFTLAGVVVALVFGDRKERSAQRRQAAREAYEEMKAVYCDAHACLDKCIREATRPGSSRDSTSSWR